VLVDALVPRAADSLVGCSVDLEHSSLPGWHSTYLVVWCSPSLVVLVDNVDAAARLVDIVPLVAVVVVPVVGTFPVAAAALVDMADSHDRFFDYLAGFDLHIAAWTGQLSLPLHLPSAAVVRTSTPLGNRREVPLPLLGVVLGDD